LHTRTHEHLKITKHTRHYNKKTNTFTINIAYQTTTTITPRTQKIAEAFGLGIDQTQKFTLYDNIKLKITPTDIVHITGDSGSGKTTLLKTIKKDLGKQAADTTHLRIDKNKPIIDTIGKTFNQALELLSKVGLNDAYIFLRPYRQLSDGQKHRYHLAKLIETNKQYWITDEFCSTLDRDTAKIVAYNLQKQARQNHKATITATTHTDLLQDLNPTIHIHKQFGKQITINQHPNPPPQPCTLTKEMQTQQGTYTDYKNLSTFHYRTPHCPPPRQIYTLKRQNELCGVIVYSYPPPNTFGRNKAWKGKFQQLQKQISTITRVITHPKYRTIGLGTKLVQDTLNKAKTPYVETLAVMAKYNPFFEKAGMQKIMESKPNKNVLHAIEQLQKLGFNPIMLGSISYNLSKIKPIQKTKITKILEELSKKQGSTRKQLMPTNTVYPTHQQFTKKIETLNETGLATALKKLAFLAQTKVYLFWQHPNPAIAE
jgi:ABC-type ATPase with predicted acetyltransferase domain